MTDLPDHQLQHRGPLREPAPPRQGEAGEQGASRFGGQATATTPEWLRSGMVGDDLRLRPRADHDRGYQRILSLQRTFGNAAVQRQLATGAKRHASRIQREPDDTGADAGPEPITHQGTGVEITPGELKPGVLGSPVPIPSKLDVQKPPGSGQGKALTVPSFKLKIDPTGMIGGILDRVDLGGFTLVNPIVAFNAKSDTLTGTATLSLPSSQYPKHLVAPTEIHVRFSSSALGKVRIEGETGPFVGELTLSIDYDDLEGLKNLKTLMLRGDIGAGIGQLSKLPRNGNFSARGRLGIGNQKYSLPIAGAAASGELSPDGVSWRGGSAGALLVPKGTFREDMDVPGLGVQGERGNRAWSGEGSTTAAMAGITGTPSIEAATQGKLGEVFPPFLYAQVTHTTRNAKGHVLGIRLSGHLRLGEGGGPGDALDMAGEAKQRDRYRQGGDASSMPTIDPAVTNKWQDMQGNSRDEKYRGSVEIFGTFDFLGGK